MLDMCSSLCVNDEGEKEPELPWLGVYSRVALNYDLDEVATTVKNISVLLSKAARLNLQHCH